MAAEQSADIVPTPTSKAVALCITTRSIGFGTITTFLAMNDLHDIPEKGTIYQFYRVSLAITEAKLQFCKRGENMIVMNDDDHMRLRNTADFMQVCKTQRIMPDPITRSVNAIGNVKVHDTQYYPRVAANRQDNEHRFIPQSERILLSNLRETVIALANPQTPLETRKGFYKNNSIPGAIWHNFILQNSDEIMPDEYDVKSLSKDMNEIQPKIYFLANKLPKYFTEPISFNFKGSKSIFCSNNQSGMRIKDRNINEQLSEYYKRMRIDGDINTFYNKEYLTSDEQLSGTLCLLGEYPLTAAAMYPTYVTRDKSTCFQTASLSYKTALNKFVLG